MADIIQFPAERCRTSTDEWAVIFVFGEAEGIEITLCINRARPGRLFVVGRCSAAPDSEILAEAPDTPAGAETVNAVAQAALRAVDLAHIDLEATVRGFPAA